MAKTEFKPMAIQFEEKVWAVKLVTGWLIRNGRRGVNVPPVYIEDPKHLNEEAFLAMKEGWKNARED
jgi:hypothetical protein